MVPFIQVLIHNNSRVRQDRKYVEYLPRRVYVLAVTHRATKNAKSCNRLLEGNVLPGVTTAHSRTLRRFPVEECAALCNRRPVCTECDHSILSSGRVQDTITGTIGFEKFARLINSTAAAEGYAETANFSIGPLERVSPRRISFPKFYICYIRFVPLEAKLPPP